MYRYVLSRIGQGIVLVFIVTLITFGLQHALPGGAARAVLGSRATAAQIAEFNHQKGLDRPLVVQYVYYMGAIVRGDLGFSYKLNQGVDSLIEERLPKTLLLTLTGLLLAVLLGIPVGLIEALRRNSAVDYALTTISFIFYAMPIFFLALLLVLALAIFWPVFPPVAPQGTGIGDILTEPMGLFLPVLALTLWNLALFSRYMRSSVIDTLSQDYIVTARSKGLKESAIVARHLLRNSCIPVVTLIGLNLPSVVAGALIVEAVFNYPGMGLLFWNAATGDDFPVELGVILVTGIATVLGSLFADLGYAALDPRVTYKT